MDITETIESQVKENKILLYMKGSPNLPQCGFSAKTVQALMACGEKFAYVDVLSNPEIRENLPKFANGWRENLSEGAILSRRCMPVENFSH